MTEATACVGASGATHRGLVRRRNEDCHGIAGIAISREDGEVIDVTTAGASPFLAVVADGLGGHPCGDTASRVAIDTVLAACPRDTDELVAAVLDANDAVVAAMSEPGGAPTMGTTIAAVVVHGDRFGVVNVGDSQVFQRAGRRLLQLSVDDVPEEDRGRRSSIVTQTLGGGRVAEMIAPHVTERDLEEPCRLLLCTDGLTNFVPLQQITTALQHHDRRTAVDVLVALALAAGAPDNVTVIVVDIQPAIGSTIDEKGADQ